MTQLLDTSPLISRPDPFRSAFLPRVEWIALPAFPQVRCLSAEYDVAAYGDELFGALGVDRTASLGKAVPKRRAEYLAGRYLAKRLLLSIGQADQVAKGQDGNPLWPAGVTGAITHTRRKAIVGIAGNTSDQFFGIDLEQWIPAAEVHEYVPTILTPSETSVLSCGLPYAWAVTLAFSAKESLFKALYSSVGRYFDFGAAELVAISCADGQFKLRLLEQLSDKMPKGREFQGQFYASDEGVFTVIASDGLARPVVSSMENSR